MKRRRKRDIPALEWMGEVAGGARATILVGSRALIENHAGLIEFTAERIRLACRGGEIVVSGEELIISDARTRSLVVSGKITDIALTPRAGTGNG
ncbi:MAG: YabP/YqfC family sporulation protein [Christensenellales bacterium]|jgi:sporulation protein YqfC